MVKDEIRSGTIQFSDSTLNYEVQRDLKNNVYIYIGLGISGGVTIPLSQLAPYIKPEPLKEFENCCKQ